MTLIEFDPVTRSRQFSVPDTYMISDAEGLMRIVFDDPDLGRRCNGLAATQHWGNEAADVRCALLVLSEVQDLPQFARLPNVHVEGETYHFVGLQSRVGLKTRVNGDGVAILGVVTMPTGVTA